MTPPLVYRIIAGTLLSLLWLAEADAQPVIKYDGSGKTLLPFDRPFILQTDFKGGEVIEVAAYEIKIINGERNMVDPFFKRFKAFRPSFVIRPPDVSYRDGVLTIPMPALKPDKNFDLLIKSKFSKDNTEIAYKILVDLYRLHHLKINDPEIVNIINAAFKKLFNKVNAGDRDVFDYNIQQFRTVIYDSVEQRMAKITTDARAVKLPDMLAQDEIDELHSCIHQEIITSYHFNLLQQLTNTAIYTDIFTGELAGNAVNASRKADLFDLSARAANIGQTLAFVDSVNRAVAVLRSLSPVYYNRLHHKLGLWSSYLVDQRKQIQDEQKAIYEHIQLKCAEAAWMTQGTGSPDLSTMGSRHVTVDAGFVTLFAKDNQNKIQAIPKLFLGLNIYFRSFDKSSDFNSFPAPLDSNATVSHHLESRRTPMRRLALTAGVTLGAFQNKDFDNVYSGFSFTLGPSVRLGKALRLSAGGAIMKRTSVNPIITRSDLTLGWYGSVSLDYDLLTAASKIISKFL